MNCFFHIIACLGSILFTFTCPYYKSSLNEAEHLMRHHPDSALQVLASIDTSTLHFAKWKAKYSLLYTMAIDKNGIDTTDLTLIQPAVEYYHKHGCFDEKAMALFYQGRILFNQGDYLSAIISFLHALEFAEQTDNVWIKGMICSHIGITYNKNYNKEDELEYAIKAYNYFLEYGDKAYIDNEAFLLGAAYHNNRLFHEADSLYNSVDSLGKNIQYTYLLRAENDLDQTPPNAEKAILNFELAYKAGAPFTLANWYQYCYALLLSGDYKAFDNLSKQLEARDSDAKSLWWKYCICKYNGDTEKALALFEDYSQKKDTVIRNLLVQSLYKAQSEYFAYNAKESEQLASSLQNSLSMAIMSSLLILFLAGFIIQKSIQNKNILSYKLSEVQNLLALSKQNESDLEASKEKMMNLQVSFAKAYKKQFASIGRLYDTNLDISLLIDKGSEHYAQMVSDILSKISSEKRKQMEFEELINKELDGIMLKLRSDFPELKEESFRFLSYVIVGFRDTTIATILNEKPTTISTRKSRIRKLILSKETPNTQLYDIFVK